MLVPHSLQRYSLFAYAAAAYNVANSNYTIGIQLLVISANRATWCESRFKTFIINLSFILWFVFGFLAVAKVQNHNITITLYGSVGVQTRYTARDNINDNFIENLRMSAHSNNVFVIGCMRTNQVCSFAAWTHFNQRHFVGNEPNYWSTLLPKM